MKALRLHAAHDLRVHEEPVPVPGRGEALVRVTAVGICGSDLHWYLEAGIGDDLLDRPLVLGHEFAGEVVDPGEGIAATGGELLAGQRVAVDPAIPCRACDQCREGNPNLCANLRFAGHSLDDGGLRQYVAWPTRCLHPLPESLSDADGALLEPLGVALHAAGLGKVTPGMSVGVFGCGPIGLLILQVARAAGATQIIAADLLAHRLEAARSYGATALIQASEATEAAAVQEATGGRGVDVAFEAAGENPAVEMAIAAARPGGKVILVGIPADDQLSFSASTARRKGLTIKLCRRMKNTYERATSLVERGLVDAGSLVTHCFPLVEGEQAFDMAHSRAGLKVVIEPPA